MKPPTRAQISGKCKAGEPISIGTSTITDPSGPEVAIAASPLGVIAAWSSSKEEVTTIPLDATGKAKGEPRVIAGSAYPRYPKLWELGDGTFVLGLARDDYKTPRALQRVDANGDHVGSPLPLKSRDVGAVTFTQDGLLFLAENHVRRSLLSITKSPEGLSMKADAIADEPRPDGEFPKDPHLLLSDSGRWRIVTPFSGGRHVVEYQDREPVDVVIAKRFLERKPRLNDEGEVFWVSCANITMPSALTLVGGKPETKPVDREECSRPAWWGVFGDSATGLEFVTVRARLKLSLAARKYWNAESAWSGAHVLVVYAEAQRRSWKIVVRAVTCT